MKKIDLDGNGFVDYNEFLTATINRDKILSQKNLEMAFQTFDKDGSGKISTSEIMQIFNNADLKDQTVFEKIVKDADENGDGEISYDEFKHLMTKFFD
jgi:calcium-dependent protein kinase